MSNEIIEQFREESRKKAPMVPKTLRLPRELLGEIKEFLREHPGIDESVVLRNCLTQGWESLRLTMASDEQSSGRG